MPPFVPSPPPASLQCLSSVPRRPLETASRLKPKTPPTLLGSPSPFLSSTFLDLQSRSILRPLMTSQAKDETKEPGQNPAVPSSRTTTVLASPSMQPMGSPAPVAKDSLVQSPSSSLMPPPPSPSVGSLDLTARPTPSPAPSNNTQQQPTTPTRPGFGKRLGKRKRPPSLEIPTSKLEHVAKRFEFSSPAIDSVAEEGFMSPACVSANRVDLNELALAEVTVEGATYAVCSRRGPRRNMEDSFRCIHNPEGLCYFGIFDGHGGRRAADFTSNYLHKLVLPQAQASASREDAPAGGSGVMEQVVRAMSSEAEAVSEGVFEDDPEKCLRNAFKKCDEEFLKLAEKEKLRDGTTALVVVIDESSIWVSHVGDSRAVLVRNGQGIQLSNDHKPSREDERQRVEAAGGAILCNGGRHRVQGVLSVSRAIGDKDYKQYVPAEPEIQKFPLTYEDEMLILASDGLWDVFSVEEVAEVCFQQLHPEEICNNLVEMAYKRGSCDNISVIAVDVKSYLASRDSSSSDEEKETD